MKYSLILISILFSSHLSFAIDRDPGGPENEPRVEVNISSPQLSTQNISLGQQTQNSGDFESLRKRLYFDPILNINTNRGSLQTGWSLPLPPNLVGMNELKLDYNHQRAENIGLGVGWTWGLPVIKENRDLFSKANFLVSQGLDNSELIQVKEVDAPLYKVTNQILKKHFSNLDSIRLRTFRPVVDNSGSLYFLVEQSSQKVGWIVVTLSGERWVLNSFGNVIAKYDSSYNSIHFDWDGPLLTQVRDSQQQWSVKLSYLKTNPQKMYLYEDEIKYLPDGLSHIQIQNKDQFKKLIVKYQTIENELYLAQSYWENGKIPLWQAHYKKFKNEEVQSPLASLRVDDKKEMIFQQNLAEPVIQETQEGQIYSDLDGDGREDLVDFNLSHLEKEIKRIFESIIKDIDDAYEMEVVKTSQQVQAEFNLLLNKAKISKAYLTNNSSYAQVRDNGLNDSFPEIFPLNIKISPFDAKKINNKIDRDEWEEVQSLINQMKVISTANGMFFVNLGGSGKKSLLYCPGNEGLNREDKDENKEKEKKKNKASNTFLYLANLKNPEIRNKFKFKDIYQHTGSTPRLFIQVVDEANLQKLWNEQGFSSGSEPRSNTLLDVAKWKEIPVSGLSCHQESVFFEPRPGQFAVWSGGQLSLLSSLTQENAKFVTVTGSKLEDFVEVDFLSVQDVESAQISLMPKFGSQKPLTLKKMSQALNITRTGQVVLATNDSTQVFQMAPEQALLTQFISPFGGKIEMKYKVQSGQWVIGQYDRRDSVKNSWKHVFNYKTDLYDSLRNLFVGFALTEETVLSPTSQVENKTIQRQYLKDNVDSVVLFQQRLGRLNGLLVSEKTLGQDETLLRQNNKEELRVHQLSSGRVWPYFRQAATQTLDRKDSQKKITLRSFICFEPSVSSGRIRSSLSVHG